jgi:hypothetical protein
MCPKCEEFLNSLCTILSQHSLFPVLFPQVQTTFAKIAGGGGGGEHTHPGKYITLLLLHMEKLSDKVKGQRYNTQHISVMVTPRM